MQTDSKEQLEAAGVDEKDNEIDVNDVGMDEMIEYVASQSTPERHVLKLVEECNELAEKAIKWHNKAEGYKPSITSILEEVADVAVRAFIFILSLDKDRSEEREELLNECFTDKLTMLYKYFKRKEAEKGK